MQPDISSRPRSSPSNTDRPCNYTLSSDAAVALIADTDAYITSLLFKPHPIYRDIRSASAVPSQSSPRYSPSLEPYFLRLLLDTLCADIQRTEEAR